MHMLLDQKLFILSQDLLKRLTYDKVIAIQVVLQKILGFSFIRQHSILFILL